MTTVCGEPQVGRGAGAPRGADASWSTDSHLPHQWGDERHWQECAGPRPALAEGEPGQRSREPAPQEQERRRPHAQVGTDRALAGGRARRLDGQGLADLDRPPDEQGGTRSSRPRFLCHGDNAPGKRIHTCSTVAEEFGCEPRATIHCDPCEQNGELGAPKGDSGPCCGTFPGRRSSCGPPGRPPVGDADHTGADGIRIPPRPDGYGCLALHASLDQPNDSPPWGVRVSNTAIKRDVGLTRTLGTAVVLPSSLFEDVRMGAAAARAIHRRHTFRSLMV